MKIITLIQKNKLAFGLLDILLDIGKENPDIEPSIPVEYLEQLVMTQHGVSKEEAEKVSEAVISTGIIRWRLHDNCIVI